MRSASDNPVFDMGVVVHEQKQEWQWKGERSIPMFGSHRLDLDSASTLLRPLCGIEYIYLNLRLHIGEQHHTTAYRDAKSCQPSSFARKFSTSNELLKKPPQSILFVKKKHDTTVAAAMNDVTA